MDLNLLLIRHAKSSWSNPNLSDYDRPLNNRGNTNAPLMGQRIKDYKINLDLLISSSANRALATAELIAKELSFDESKLISEPRLYHASRDIFIEILSSQSAKSIAMVGHNPGIQDFSYWLCSEPTKNFSTCGVIYISFKLDHWFDMYRNCGKFETFEYPKLFK